MALGLIHHPTELSTRNLPLGGGGVKHVRLVRLTSSPPSASQKMRGPQRLKALRVTTSCYKNSFTYFYEMLLNVD
jgi:hypothetical protein